MTIPTFMNSWTESDIDSIRTYWKLSAAKNFMQKPVTAENWFTLDFVRP